MMRVDLFTLVNIIAFSTILGVPNSGHKDKVVWDDNSLGLTR